MTAESAPLRRGGGGIASNEDEVFEPFTIRSSLGDGDSEGEEMGEIEDMPSSLLLPSELLPLFKLPLPLL